MRILFSEYPWNTSNSIDDPTVIRARLISSFKEEPIVAQHTRVHRDHLELRVSAAV
jgi:hypothetical protein